MSSSIVMIFCGVIAMIVSTFNAIFYYPTQGFWGNGWVVAIAWAFIAIIAETKNIILRKQGG